MRKWNNSGFSPSHRSALGDLLAYGKPEETTENEVTEISVSEYMELTSAGIKLRDLVWNGGFVWPPGMYTNTQVLGGSAEALSGLPASEGWMSQPKRCRANKDLRLFSYLWKLLISCGHAYLIQSKSGHATIFKTGTSLCSVNLLRGVERDDYTFAIGTS